MTKASRRQFWSLMLSSAGAGAQVVKFSDERVAVIRPILERRELQLQTLRDFPISDSVSPRDASY